MPVASELKARTAGPNWERRSVVTQKSPTIMDVARRAEVSVGTVSNVLNGTIRVSEAKRQRVAAAIAELGYSQNTLARSLRKRQSPLVGLCLPFTSISYFSALLDACESVVPFELMRMKISVTVSISRSGASSIIPTCFLVRSYRRLMFSTTVS